MIIKTILPEHFDYLSRQSWRVKNDFNELSMEFSKDFRMAVLRARGIIRHFESVHVSGNTFKMDFDLKENEIKPVFKLDLEPIKYVEIEPKVTPIEGTNLVILTYPSRLNFEE
jgi:hypothetical protein